MKVDGDVKRGVWARAGALLLASALLASCGGSQVETFVPRRVIAFGDESSRIETDGRKYTVNAYQIGSTTALDCRRNVIWTQYVANAYGLPFPECPSPGSASSPSLMRAEVDAGVAELGLQIDSFVAAGSFSGTDLVTVMVGMHDIIDIFTAGGDDATMLAAARQAGTALGDQVFRLVSLGAKILIATVPDVGRTPYALALTAQEQALLSNLTHAFNDRMRLRLAELPGGGGRSVGLVLADDIVDSIIRGVNLNGFTNVVEAVCQPSPALPDCTTSTVVVRTPEVMPATWLWADSLRLGPGAHASIGASAESRARNNPF